MIVGIGKERMSRLVSERRKMKTTKVLGGLVLLITALPGFPEDQSCKHEYERGRREMGAYAEMAGVMEGVIYGYSLELSSPEVCLPTEAKLRVKAIADAMMSEPFAKNPVLMDDVPTRAEAHEFLKRFFPCRSRRQSQSDK